MQILALQTDIDWEDPAANREKVRRLLDAAPPKPGALVVLPEMFATGFTMDPAKTAEPAGGETELFLSGLAKKRKACVLAGLPTRAKGGKFHNEAVAFAPDGGVLARYAKLHPFTPAGESDAYAAGKKSATFAWGGFTVAPLICYDLRFPEAFRVSVRSGATLFPVIASWPGTRIAHWTALLRARAIENQAVVVGVNRCGADPKADYPGKSAIFGPDGALLAEAGETEGILAAEAEPTVVAAYRKVLPFLKDLRDDGL